MIASDWHLAQIALQILTEERLGRRMREARSEEDEMFDRAREALNGAR